MVRRRKMKNLFEPYRQRSVKCHIKKYTKKPVTAISFIAIGLASLSLITLPPINQITNALNIASLSQTSGPASGGNEILIKGSGFTRQQYYLNTPIKQIVSTGANTYVLTNSGRLFATGSNDNGESLQDSSIKRQTKPVELTSKVPAKIASIHPSGHGIFAITDNGVIYAGGNNLDGALGTGKGQQQTKFINISQFINNSTVKEVSSQKYGFTLILTTDNKIYFCGNNTNTPFAYREKLPDGSTYYGSNITTPIDFTYKLNGEVPNHIYSSDNLVATQSGKLLQWQPFTGNIIDVTHRYRLSTNEHFIKISRSYSADSLIGLTNKGRVFTWGSNKYGQIGNNTINSDTYKPTDITNSFQDKRVADVYAGSLFNYALTQDGTILQWGTFRGSIAINHQSADQHILTPSPIELNYKIKMLSLGGTSSLILTDDNRLIARGTNNRAQFGNGIPSAEHPVETMCGSNGFVPITCTTDTTENYNFISTRSNEVASNIQAIKLGDRYPDFTVIDDNTVKIVTPQSNIGKVDLTLVDNNGIPTLVSKVYEYTPSEIESQHSSASQSSQKHITPAAPNTGYRKSNH